MPPKANIQKSSILGLCMKRGNTTHKVLTDAARSRTPPALTGMERESNIRDWQRLIYGYFLGEMSAELQWNCNVHTLQTTCTLRSEGWWIHYYRWAVETTRHILARYLSAEQATGASHKDCRTEPNPMIDRPVALSWSTCVCAPYKSCDALDMTQGLVVCRPQQQL